MVLAEKAMAEEMDAVAMAVVAMAEMWAVAKAYRTPATLRLAGRHHIPSGQSPTVQ